MASCATIFAFWIEHATQPSIHFFATVHEGLYRRGGFAEVHDLHTIALFAQAVCDLFAATASGTVKNLGHQKGWIAAE